MIPKFWKIEELTDDRLIDIYQMYFAYDFNEDFKEFILKNNGGWPDYGTFDTDKIKGRCFKEFLSFNLNSMCSVWKYYTSKATLSFKYIPFGLDSKDNIIAFSRDNKVVWISKETNEIEHIADSFKEFMDALRFPDKPADIIWFRACDWLVEEFEEAGIDWFNSPEYKYCILDNQWCKDNELCVSLDIWDLAVVCFVAAKKEWVEKNYPKVIGSKCQLTPEYFQHPGYGDCIFVEYTKENLGLHDFVG